MFQYIFDFVIKRLFDQKLVSTEVLLLFHMILSNSMVYFS